MYFTTLSTPLGFMRPVSTGTAIMRLDWQQHPFSDADRPDHVSRETCDELNAYLNGENLHFSTPLDLSAQSIKLRQWLSVMQQIPIGNTISYAEFAARWGNRGAARAAGDACRRNPIPIIIPCHRVISADGGVNQYSGGSETTPTNPGNLERKLWLQSLEKQHKPA